MMLLSATPHDGSARSFASLMSLLDPTAISDPDDYTPEDFRSKGLVIRRFKKDIRDQVRPTSRSAADHCLRQKASAAEEAAYRALLEVRFTQGGQHKAGRQQELQRIGMQKGCSPARLRRIESTKKRIELLRARQRRHSTNRPRSRAWTELATLRCAPSRRRLQPSTSACSTSCARLRSPGSPTTPADRLVIFSERIETLRWLTGPAHGRPEAQTQAARQVLHGRWPTPSSKTWSSASAVSTTRCAYCCALTSPAKA
jgi:hypothetical protein